MSRVDPTDPRAGESGPFAAWLGLIRFSHTLFALPFAALATVMAVTVPMPEFSSQWIVPAVPTSGFSIGDGPVFRIRDLVGILVCMVAARSAAMAFNRLADHQIDAANPRTVGRHLPAGVLTRGAVIRFSLTCCAAFIASTLLFWPNWVPLAGSLPVLLFLLGYSLAKRFTSAAHLWLGVALSLSPICAWLAIRGPTSLLSPSDLLPPVLLAAAVAAWVTGFDIIYACQDAAFDTQAGLHSVPARFGMQGAFRIAAASHLVMVVVLVLLPLLSPQLGFGVVYWIALLAITGLVIRQHTLVRPDNLARVGEAFFHANVAISLLLLIAGAIDCFV